MPKRLITYGQRNPLRSFRGKALLLCSSLIGLYGVGLLKSNLPQAAVHNLTYAFQLASIHTWGWIWLGVSGVTVFGAFFNFDRWAFLLGTYLLSVWSFFYFFAWIQGEQTSRPWLSSALYAVVAGLILLCSGQPDDAEHLMKRGGRNGLDSS